MLFMRYFNPRSREGSDPTAVFLLHFPSISIHAPARGATAGITATQNLSQDFNPRSREGSDTVCSPFVISSQYFNPRSREGSDLPSWCIWSMASIISIHAPARGATKVTVHFNQNHSNISIHAPARGATYSPHEIKERLQINFNPRSREGSDTIRSHFPSFCCHFNPRSREGSDRRSPCLFRTRSRFQSTLPRGERPVIFVLSTTIQLISIHAPARGATLYHLVLQRGAIISIHAPARGATRSSWKRCRMGKFQSTLPRGERHQKTA